jgi:ATP-dependent Clp protease ATP-binding subunit ClpC
MTSNIWQDEFTEKAVSIGFDVEDNEEDSILADYEKAWEKIKNNLTDYFSPEFVNRIDKVIVFNPLDKKEIKKIVKLQLDDLEWRLEKVGITLTYDQKVLTFITKTVYNPDFWAREIRRYISDNIEDIIAEKIITQQKKKDFELKLEKNSLEIV